MLSYESGHVVTEKSAPRFRIYVERSKTNNNHLSLPFSELSSLHVFLEKFYSSTRLIESYLCQIFLSRSHDSGISLTFITIANLQANDLSSSISIPQKLQILLGYVQQTIPKS